MTRLLIVPAAGLGSRLHAAAPKVLVPVAGRPMLDHLLERFEPYVDHVVLVAHPSFAARVAGHVTAVWGSRIAADVTEQPAPTGMLDALLTPAAIVARHAPGRVWSVWCDQVGLLPDTLERLARAEETDPPPALVFPTVRQEPPYIHLERDAGGRIRAVRQRREGDAMPEVGESDIGLFSLSHEAYTRHLPEFARSPLPGSGTGERNFLPFIPWLAARARVDTIHATDPREATGINTPEDLHTVECWLMARTAAR
jgi:bifunctional N-acetylglucosamine-1-phosphate-uridyltransferase/glucosamine-1-phosphate-acetyltransferase GlmU-like protein